MKNLKKILCLIIAVIMLMTAVPVESFAFFDGFWAEAVKVEFMDDLPVSYRYVQSLIDGNDTVGLVEYDLASEPDLTYKVHFSNGRTVETNNNDMVGRDLKSGVLNTSVSMFVDPVKCRNASHMGETTVEVTVIVKVYNIDKVTRSYTFKLEKDFVYEIVSDIRLSDKVNSHYDVYSPIQDFVGRDFTVEYYDGRKETLTLTDCGKKGYYLGDKPVKMWCAQELFDQGDVGWEGGIIPLTNLFVSYIDAVSVVHTKRHAWFINSFDIVDYKLNGKGGLTELTYKITYSDNRVFEKTGSFETPVNFVNSGYIDSTDEFDVYVYVRSIDGKSFYITCNAGDVNFGIYTKHQSDDITEFCNCLCHKEGTANSIVYTLLSKIWKLLRINEHCQCGYWH